MRRSARRTILLAGTLAVIEPHISVVVCTRDRGNSVVATAISVLASIGVVVELIIIDQSSSDETARHVGPLLGDDRVRYVPTPTVGVSCGRNIGLSLASNPLVLITDDDVEVDQHWALRFANAMMRHDQAAVGFCRVVAGQHDTGLGFVPDHVVDREILATTMWSKAQVRGIGAGMAVRRDIVLGFGGFDEVLGPGARLRSGEDRDLAARALGHGYFVLQAPDAIVTHNGFRTWDEGAELTRRDWYGIGAAYAKQVRTGDLKIVPALAHEVLYYGLIIPVVRWVAGHRRTGLRRMGHFFSGLSAGLRTPLDRDSMLYSETTAS